MGCAGVVFVVIVVVAPLDVLIVRLVVVRVLVAVHVRVAAVAARQWERGRRDGAATISRHIFQIFTPRRASQRGKSLLRVAPPC